MCLVDSTGQGGKDLGERQGVLPITGAGGVSGLSSISKLEVKNGNGEGMAGSKEREADARFAGGVAGRVSFTRPLTCRVARSVDCCIS